MKKKIALFTTLIIILSLFANISAISADDQQYGNPGLPSDFSYKLPPPSVDKMEAVYAGDVTYDELENSANSHIYQLPQYNASFAASAAKYYNFLTAPQKQAYDSIKYAADNFITGACDNFSDPRVILLPSNFTADDLYVVMNAFNNDNPQYFWLAKGYVIWGYPNVLGVSIQSMYYTTPAVVNGVTNNYGAADRTVINAKQKIIDDNIPRLTANTSGKTDGQKVRIIHDNLINAIDYDWNGVYPPPSDDNNINDWIDYNETHTIYGVFDPQKNGAVCEGYAKTFLYLLNYEGIDCYYETGDALDVNTGKSLGLHAWNIDKINGVWYNMDTTWDDRGNGSTIPLYYMYFNIPYSVFSIDHKLDAEFTGSLPKSEAIKTDADYVWSGSNDYTMDNTTLIGYSGVGGNIVLPSGITIIGEPPYFAYAFGYANQCYLLTSIKLPASVTEISDFALSYLQNVTFEIPRSVTVIGDYSFTGGYNIAIKGYTGSYAEQYAKDNSIPFIPIYDYATSSITGKISSYNPQNAATVKLLQNGVAVYTVTIPAQAGSGLVAQTFSFPSVASGIYTIEVTKQGHIKYTLNGVIADGNLDLTNDSRANIKLVTLAAGDITGDGKVTIADLNVVLNNFNKSSGLPSVNSPDITGDGKVTIADLNVVLNNFNKTQTAVQY